MDHLSTIDRHGYGALILIRCSLICDSIMSTNGRLGGRAIEIELDILVLGSNRKRGFTRLMLHRLNSIPIVSILSPSREQPILHMVQPTCSSMLHRRSFQHDCYGQHRDCHPCWLLLEQARNDQVLDATVFMHYWLNPCNSPRTPPFQDVFTIPFHVSSPMPLRPMSGAVQRAAVYQPMLHETQGAALRKLRDGGERAVLRSTDRALRCRSAPVGRAATPGLRGLVRGVSAPHPGCHRRDGRPHRWQ